MVSQNRELLKHTLHVKRILSKLLTFCLKQELMMMILQCNKQCLHHNRKLKLLLQLQQMLHQELMLMHQIHNQMRQLLQTINNQLREENNKITVMRMPMLT